jgi:hypothetical protein
VAQDSAAAIAGATAACAESQNATDSARAEAVKAGDAPALSESAKLASQSRALLAGSISLASRSADTLHDFCTAINKRGKPMLDKDGLKAVRENVGYIFGKKRKATRKCTTCKGSGKLGRSTCSCVDARNTWLATIDQDKRESLGAFWTPGFAAIENLSELGQPVAISPSQLSQYHGAPTILRAAYPGYETIDALLTDPKIDILEVQRVWTRARGGKKPDKATGKKTGNSTGEQRLGSAKSFAVGATTCEKEPVSPARAIATIAEALGFTVTQAEGTGQIVLTQP